MCTVRGPGLAIRSPILSALTCAAALLAACGRSAPPAADAARPLAVVGVTVVPMDGERRLPDQTVVVRAGRIAQIGPAVSTFVPDDAQRVDGRGRYLIPGLADMHVHLWSESELALYVAHGVTFVRNMAGELFHLNWRERVARGELLGPTIYTAGAVLDGEPPVFAAGTVTVRDAGEAERVVAEQKALGYDFLKVYQVLTRPAYEGIAAAAGRHGIPFAGHISRQVGLDAALRLGQASGEHLYYYALAFPPPPPATGAERDVPPWMRASAGMDEGRFPALAAATRDAGLWSCPTLSETLLWVTAEEARPILRRPEMALVAPNVRAFWDPDFATEYLSPVARYVPPAGAAPMRRWAEVKKKLTKALVDAGAGVLAGTDAGVPLLVPGASLQEELEAMVDAGLTPYQALRSATAAPAEFVGTPGEFGTVAVGARADLVLLDGDPLADVRNVARRAGVIVRGRWLARSELRRLLGEVQRGFEPPADWFAGLPPLDFEGEPAFAAEYALRFNGVEVGRTRLAEGGLAPRRRALAAQTVNRDRGSARTARLLSDPAGAPVRLTIEGNGREGRGTIELTAAAGRISGTARYPIMGTVSRAIEGRADDLVDVDALGPATALRIADRLAGLPAGETLELTVHEPVIADTFRLRTHRLRLVPEREPAPGGGRAYTIEGETLGVDFGGRLLLDAAARPLVLVLETEFGVIEHRRGDRP